MHRRVARGRLRTSRSLTSRLLVEWLEDRTQPATVTTTADAGPGSLRDAIVSSKQNEVIDFALPPGPNVITLTTGELVVPHSLTILGPGADQLVVSGNNSSRVFSAAGLRVSISNLTVADGRVASPEVGGAIWNQAKVMELTGVVVRDSRVDTVSGTAQGGGIYNSSPFTLSLVDVTVHSNAADIGGGVYSQGGDLSGINLTVSGNTARASGGGLRTAGDVNLVNVTVANNSQVGIRADGGSLSYGNSLFAGNAGGNIASFKTIVFSGGSNLSSDGTGELTAPGDLPNTNPRLGPLGDYGGSIPLHVLLPGSPAIDGGTNGIETDPRGVFRPGTDGDGDGVGGADIGAFEVPVYTVTDFGDFTTGSLRAAIDQNNLIGGGRIAFEIDVGGVATIRPLGSQGFSAFAPITQPVFIDGWSQGGPGYAGPPRVELDGSFLMPGMGVNGLVIQSVGVVVAGLAVNNFPTDGGGAGYFSGGYGIVVRTSGDATPGVWLHGNYVGTDPTGSVAEPNASGGIFVDGGAPAFIENPPTDVLLGTNADGINDAAEANVLSGNAGPGVTIDSRDVRVAGNFIGTDALGVAPLGNAGTGILARGQVLIGGPAPNVIAFNGAAGVSVDNSYEITIAGNSIHSNAAGGIVYLAPFPQPPNVPILTAASAVGGTTVQGIITSSFRFPQMTIEFYAEPAGTPPGAAQGKTFLGSTVVFPDAGGFASFTVSGLPPVSIGQVITATATDPQGSTSTFSFGIEAAGPTARYDVLVGDPPPGGHIAGAGVDILILATDAAGRPTPFYTGTVRLTSSDPQAVLPPDYTLTPSDNGSKGFVVTLRTAGIQTVTVADVVDPTIIGTGSTFVRSAPAALFTLSAPPVAFAGNPVSILVTARDAFGNVATDYAGTVAFTSSDPQAVLPLPVTFTSEDQGQRTVTVEFRTVGNWTLTARDTVNGTIGGTAAVTVSPGAATRFTVVGPAGVTAGVGAAFTVTAFDDFGNLATGYLGQVMFSSTDTQATLPPAYVFTPADSGRRAFTVTFRTAGTQGLTVRDVEQGFVTGSGSTAVAPGPATRFDLGPPIAANAGVASPITITAFDAFGNVATSYTGTVAFTSTDPQASLPASFAFTAADAGRRTVSATLRTAGPQTITVRDTANAALAQTVSASVAPGPAARFDLVASSATAGAIATVTVTAFDAFGNVAVGYRGTVAFTSTDPRATLPAAYQFTAVDAGRHTFAVTYRTAGSQTVTVRDTVNGAITGSASTTVAAGPASRFELVPTGPATAGAPLTVTITPFDAFGNVTTSYAGTVRFTSTDPRASLPVDVRFLPGRGGQSATATATFRTAGNQTLTASDTSNPALVGSAAVAVSPGVATRFALAGLSGTAAAGTPLLATVTAFDAFDNVATGYAGAVAFTSSDPQAALPAAYTFTHADAGVHTFAVSFGTAGNQTFTADDGAGVIGQAAVSVTPAAAESVTVTGPTGPVVAGGQVLFTVVLRDRFGNVATDYSGTLTVTSTDQQAVLPAPAGLPGGSGTIAVTFRTAGTHSVTVGDGTISGAAVGVAVFAAAATRFNLVAPPSATVGTPFDVTVTALDAFGNVAAGYGGIVRISSSGPPVEGTFTPADAGRRTLSLTLSAAGDQTVTATDTLDPAVRGEAAIAAANPTPGPITLDAGNGRVGRAFTLGVTGGPFVPGSVVVFAGRSLTTRFVDAGRLEADVPTEAVAADGAVPVLVRTPGPGGGDSPAATFTITPFTLTPVPEEELITPVVTVPFGEEIARFRADDPTVTVADLTAIIDWGDGTIEPGQVVGLADGSFAVVGSHTYPDTLSYLVTVTVRGPGGVEVASFRFAVVSTASARPVLGVTRVVLVPSGAATGTAEIEGVRADFERTTGMDRTLLIRVSQYEGDPTEQLDPAVVLAGAYDIQLIGAIADDRLTVTFEYDAPPGAIPRFQYFNVETGQYEDVVGDPILSSSLLIDTEQQIVRSVFTANSTPAVTALLGTVFVVTVSVPPPPPQASVAVSVALDSRFSDFPTGTAGVGFTRLVSATLVANAPPGDGGGGDAALIAIIGEGEAAADGNLPFLPADELSLTVRPSQDQVLTPADNIIPPGEATPLAEDVLLGPYLPDASPAPGTAAPYLNDGVRPKLRVFRDRGQIQPGGSSSAPQAPLAAPTSGGQAAPAGSSGGEEGIEEETSAAPGTQEGTDHQWWWAGVAVAAAVGLRAAVLSAVGSGRPRYRLGLDSADL